MKDSKDNGLKKEKKIYCILVSVFIITGAIFIFNKFIIGDKSTAVDNDVVAKDSINIDENKASIDDKEQDKLKQIVKEFISTYYAYDKDNPLKNITDSKKYLTDDFYNELYNVEMENTKVPTYAYRKVISIELTDFEQDENVYRYTALVYSDLIDENKQKYHKTKVEFCIDLTKDSGDWKISYFTLLGRGIQKYE